MNNIEIIIMLSTSIFGLYYLRDYAVTKSIISFMMFQLGIGISFWYLYYNSRIERMDIYI